MKPAIIAIGYNRPDSLKRLLGSLAAADYGCEDVKLIISIDRSKKENDEKNLKTLKVAQDFVWNFGEKEVIYRDKNMGLRPHVVACGNLSETYGSIIMLEDDIFVSPLFYRYACQALEFSKDKEYISGISLYNHRMNFQTREVFIPIEDGYDNWYLKFPQSWGQAWTAGQWNGFRNWYEQNSSTPPSGDDMPPVVARWPETSWMKYFAKYMITSNKFHLYPKHSLTTNFCESGTNSLIVDLSFQVPLFMSADRPFNFSDIQQSSCVYDQFFENVTLYKSLGIPWDKLTVDLNGEKPVPSEGFLLSRKHLDYKIEKSFGCVRRPLDANIINSIPGESFFLYKLSEYSKNTFAGPDYMPVGYDFIGLTTKKEIRLVKHFIMHMLRAIKRRIIKK